MRRFGFALGAAAVALGLSAGSTQAAFINGAMSVSNGGLTLPTPPSNFIVSGLTTFTQTTPLGNGNANGCTGTFFIGGGCNGSPPMAASTFSLGGSGITYTYAGFQFNATSITLNGPPTPLKFSGNSGTDGIAISLAGTVHDTNNVLQDTAWTGNWTANGACTGGPTQCLSNLTASWSVSIAALNTPPRRLSPLRWLSLDRPLWASGCSAGAARPCRKDLTVSSMKRRLPAPLWLRGRRH
jgi:hypothetical protein